MLGTIVRSGFTFRAKTVYLPQVGLTIECTMVKRVTTRRRRPPSPKVAVAPVFDVTRLGPFGSITNLANLSLFVLAKLKPNLLQLVSTSLISIAATLLAAQYLFGNYFVPAAYQTDRDAAQTLQARVAKIEADFTKQIEENSSSIEENKLAIRRNKEEINSVATQVGQQVDGFWIPLTFDVYKINESQKFILPISAKHKVRMMITASNTDLDFFEKYLTLYVDDQALTPIAYYINHDTSTLRLRELKADRFDNENDSQSFELRVRRGLSAAERAEFEADLKSAQRPVHSDISSGQISVLLVVRRPILISGDEENLPPPGALPGG
jgi:hypothetical protein